MSPGRSGRPTPIWSREWWRRRAAEPRSRALGALLLADAGLLPDLAAEVVELCATHVADGSDLDLLDLRRVEGERPLDADTEGVLPDGEGLANTRALPLDHNPLEDLDAPALALDHLEVDADSVAGLEVREIVAQLLALEDVDHVRHTEDRSFDL